MSKCLLYALGHIVFDSPAAGDGLRREKEKNVKWVNGAQGDGAGGLQGLPLPSTVSYTTLMWELDHLLPNIRPTNPYSCDKGRLGGLYLVAYSNFKGCSNVFTLLNEAEGTLSPSSLYLRCSLIVKITQNWPRMFNSIQLLVLGTGVTRHYSEGLWITSACIYIKGFAYPVRNRFNCQLTALDDSKLVLGWWWQLTAQCKALLGECIMRC